MDNCVTVFYYGLYFKSTIRRRTEEMSGVFDSTTSSCNDEPIAHTVCLKQYDNITTTGSTHANLVEQHTITRRWCGHQTKRPPIEQKQPKKGRRCSKGMNRIILSNA